MSFHNVELAQGVNYGSVSGFGFGTLVQTTATGHEHRVARQSQARRRLVPIKALLDDSAAKELLRFGLSRRGSLHSFKVKDWTDYTTNADGVTAPTALDQIIGTGDGTKKAFQITKTYNLGASGEYVRTITLPESSGMLVAVNGVTTGAYTLNSAGVITLTTAAPNGQLVTCGCEFRVPVRFEKSVDDFFRMQATAYGAWTADDLALIEVLDEVEYPERWFAGGMKDHGAVGGDVSIAFNDGQLHFINPTTAINLYLPPATYHPGGWNVFAITVNTGSAGTIQVRDDAGNTVGSTFGIGATRQLGLVRSGSTYSWVIR